jgi:IS30 family transposase
VAPFAKLVFVFYIAPRSPTYCIMPHLTIEQRYSIELLKSKGFNQKEIAAHLAVSPSTISRELARNKDKLIGYQAAHANNLALQRHKRQPYKLTPEIMLSIKEKLNEYLSPGQITGRFRLEHKPVVSYETIYKYVYSTSGTPENLTHLLRWNRPVRRKRSNKYKTRGQILNKISIDERPPIVNERNRLGDFEVDLVIGKGHKLAIITAVDRTTRMLSAKLIPDKSADETTKGIIELLEKQPVKTITSDNGKEFARHEEISKTLNANYYFAHPYSSWERGSNENMNGLLRQFIPKNRPFEDLTQEQLDTYVDLLNNRPRKTLNFITPIEHYQDLLKNHTFI